jgi:hypothetical protein
MIATQKTFAVASAAILVLACTQLCAQQPSPPADASQQKQLENWQHTESGKMGKEEPSSQAEMPKPQTAFIHGALAAAGAPTDVDTVPAKFSERNARDDKLITLPYTFKNLSEDQRRQISAALKGQGATAAYKGDIGTVVPFAMELRPVPEGLAAQVPQTKGFQYLNADDRVLLISPSTRIVVGVFPASS